MAMRTVLQAVRPRLRTLMLLVLFVAAALGTERTWRRRREYLGRAAYHAAEEAKRLAQAKVLAVEVAQYRLMLRRPCGNIRRHVEAMDSLSTRYATLGRVALVNISGFHWSYSTSVFLHSSTWGSLHEEVGR